MNECFSKKNLETTVLQRGISLLNCDCFSVEEPWAALITMEIISISGKNFDEGKKMVRHQLLMQNVGGLSGKR